MSQQPTRDPLPLDDPALLPFLPLIYVAWADGDLSAAEIGEICGRLEERLGERCREVLAPWLERERPPAAADLARLLARIRRLTAGMSPGEKLSLTGLGLELARAGDQRVEAAERRALGELEEALGIAGTEAARQLLVSRRPAAVRPASVPAFEVASMARLLDGDQRAVRERVRQLLRDPALRPPEDLDPEDRDREAYREWVLGVCRRLADEGLGALAFPEAALPGNAGGDLGAFIAAFETLAFGDLSVLVKFGVQFGLFGGSIVNLGTERHHRAYLPAAATLELPGCFAMTETGHGSNVQDLETVARFDPAAGDFVLNTPHRGARKDYIGNAARHGRVASVFAQLAIGEEEHGVHVFVVPIRDADGRPLPGVEIEDCGDKMGLDGVDNGRLRFTNVRVPRESLLDRFATVDADGAYHSPIASPTKRFFTMLGTLVGGRVSVALAGLSVAKTALAVAVRYGAERRQFGPPGEPETVLLDYQTHQRRLLPRLATTYALAFALDDLRRRYAAAGPDDDRRELEGFAAGLKAFATWHATDTVQTCRECCGGQGYLTVNRFAALKADSDVFTTFEGDNVVLLQLVAKGLLSGYKRQFSELSFLGLLRYAADRAAANLMEQNPVVTRRTAPEHLRDRDFHLAALRWREQHRLSSVARRLKKRLDAGMESSQAMIEVQSHLVETAQAHVERLILERFTKAIDACEDPDLRPTLDHLATLFAVSRLEADRGYFLEHGYFEPPKARALRKLLNDLCQELRPQAVPLVDAFAIPEEVLPPIARF